MTIALYKFTFTITIKHMFPDNLSHTHTRVHCRMPRAKHTHKARCYACE